MKVFVGCSSKNEIKKKYLDNAKYIANNLIELDYELVFGCDDTGIMGIFYQAFKNNNKKVYGYNIKIYNKNLECSEVIMNSSIPERTNRLLEESDVWLFLPGGIGTFQELFSAIDIKRTFGYNQELLIYNEDGFYDDFINLLDNITKNKFCETSVHNKYKIFNNKEDLVKCMKGLI